MRYIPPNKHVHSGQLERWLGAEKVEAVSRAMRNFYAPIAVGGVPGNVWAQPGGDFTGVLRAGYEANGFDRAADLLRRLKRSYVHACRPNGQLNTGFASLSDLISKVTISGKMQSLAFQKNGTVGFITGGCNSFWRVGVHPPAGSAAGAAPGGTVPTNATTGSIIFTNPSGTDTTHVLSAFPIASVAATQVLLYDRIFAVAKTMNSTGTEAVTGVPTRYTSTTPTAVDYAGGNFLFMECGTVLPATAHNWTVCTYTDQDGNAGATLPSVTGNSANVVNALDMPVSAWFAPLASADIGVKALTQMQCSALVATGAIDFVIGHPLQWMPCWTSYVVCAVDSINSAWNFVRVLDNACLALLEPTKSQTNASNVTGTINIGQG